jgi:hypothetical protein
MIERGRNKLRMGKAVITAGVSLLLLFSIVGVTIAQNEEGFIRESTISKRDAVLLSVLFPGLGQMTSGHMVKGVALFFSGAASLAVFVNSNEDYKTKLSTYNNDKDILNAMALKGRTNYQDANNLYVDLRKQSNRLDGLNNSRNIALYIAAGVYAYNLFDAIFLSSASTENMKAESRSTFVVQSALVDRKPGIVISKSF